MIDTRDGPARSEEKLGSQLKPPIATQTHAKELPHRTKKSKKKKKKKKKKAQAKTQIMMEPPASQQAIEQALQMDAPASDAVAC